MLWYLYLQKQNKNQGVSVLPKLKIYSSRLLLRGMSKAPACSEQPAPCVSSSDSVTVNRGGVVSTKLLFLQNSYESTCLTSLQPVA